MTDCVLAIDQGTSNTKVLLVARDGAILARASTALGVTHPKPGWAEQSAETIWEGVLAAIGEAVSSAPGANVTALAISNQRETVVLWDRATGKPLAPAIVWQCRRTSERCAALRAQGHARTIAHHTGLGIDPLFPAAKIAWLLDHVPDARARAERGEIACGTIDSWLIWNLTKGTVHATDHSNASRTQLFNLDAACWDEEMLSLFRVPGAILPDVRPSDSRFGAVGAGVPGVASGTPIHAVLGDSHAAMAGHGFGRPGEAKVTCGTGSSMMVLTPARVRSRNGLSSTIAWSRGATVQHALEGNISVSGHAAAFATRLLNLEDEEALTQIARSVNGSDGVTFVPALAGLGAPHWLDLARGQLGGMSLGTRPAHVARAVFEGIALQIRDVFTAVEADLEIELPFLSVDGGAAKNDFLVQMMADLIARPVRRPPMTDASAFGAARFAQQALGWIETIPPPGGAEIFTPRIPDIERDRIVVRWRAAVRRATLELHGEEDD